MSTLGETIKGLEQVLILWGLKLLHSGGPSLRKRVQSLAEALDMVDARMRPEA